MVRTNADRTVIWVVDARPKTPSHGIICSLNLVTREFISAPGPFATDVSVKGGFPFAPFRR